MNKTILVLINGHAGVGKDTFVDLCRQFAAKRDCEVMNLHRSDAPKAALTSLGWDGVKDGETRAVLKDIIDWMEPKGLLNKYLETQVEAAKSVFADKDLMIFYHVRDPEIMYALIEHYIGTELQPISVLIRRDLNQPAEPSDWWGDLENADYMVSIQLPPRDMSITAEIAKQFTDFLLDEKFIVVKQEEYQNEHKNHSYDCNPNCD